MDAAEIVMARFEFRPGQLVREIGYGPDVDHGLREEIIAVTGRRPAHRTHLRCPDALLLWFRDGDGDLAELLLSCGEAMNARSWAWLLVPKPGRAGHVPPAAIERAADRAGLSRDGQVDIFADWDATGLRLPRR